jgi:hypothetical protein
MVELTKSLLSFSWAQSLLGAQQALRVLTPGRTAAQPGTALDAVTRATEGQLGGVIKGAFEAGDMLQRGAIDLAASLLTRDALNPAAVARGTSAALRQAWDVLRFLASGADLRLAWQEFADKLQVFRWVRDVGTILHLPAEGTFVPLADLVARAYALDEFSALWAVEGAGHFYADSFWGRGEPPRGLLSGPEADAVPAKALTMLHAGIGLSFAQHLLEKVTPTTPGRDLELTLRLFLALCHANSRPGYVGAALESLGLVARVFHPLELVPVLDRYLATLDPEAQAYYWHGVGRAIYFSPTYFLPFGRSPWRAVEMARGEAPHELGRLNAVAGLTWAVTLVNMRRPQVLEAVVNAHGEEFVRDGAFANGVSSSIIMRYDTTPEAPFIAAFCGHQPAGPAPLAQLWGQLVRGPCEEGLGKLYPALKESQRLGEVFRYQPLTDPVDRPARGTT